MPVHPMEVVEDAPKRVRPMEVVEDPPKVKVAPVEVVSEPPAENLQGFLEQPPAVATISSPVQTDATPLPESQATIQPTSTPGGPATYDEMEQVAMTPIVTVPRFGEPGTAKRGFSELLSLPVEVLTSPGTPLIAAAQLIPGLREVVDTTFAASLTKSAAQRLGEASATGNKEQFVRGVGELVLGGLAARGAATQPPPLLPQTKAELSTLPGERTTDAVPQREAAPLPLEEPPGNRPQVGSQVRKQAQAAEAEEAITLPTKPAAESEVPRAAAPIEEPKAAGQVEPPAISEGPGAASPGDIPKTSQLSQLTEAVRSAEPVKRAMGEAVRSELAAVKEQTGQMAASALDNLRSLGRAALDKLSGAVEWTGFRDTLGKFSGAINRNDYELLRFTSAIRKHVPDPMRRQAIVNWLQADGDAATLTARAAASKGTLKLGYELANQLTPDEKVVAGHVRSYLDSKLAEGMEAGLLKAGIENYVTQVWKRPNPITNKLMGEAASGKLHTDFKYARRRIFESYFEGEQAGYTPKIKDIGALVAAYDQSFSRAIASRNFVKALHEGVASDGRPLVEVSGFASDLSDKGGNALLVKPRARPEDLQGYRPIDHPAMRGWKWAGTDKNGNPVLFQGDMLAHPEIYAHLRNALGTSALRRNAFMSTLMKGQAFLKQSKLSLSGFHFTQEAAHGLAHRINPLAPRKIDFADPNQAGLADHGLQVADYHSYSAFAEGLSGAGGLYEKLPGIGKWLTRYNEYLFQEYIPRLKMTMALDALERNRSRYGKQLNDDQILDLTARQANAAFGEQNYMMLGRNPTFQDFLRLAFLAPDFLEARARFVSQAFTRYGAEQRIALALQAATLYVGARLLNTAISGDPHWDPKDAFEIFAGKRRYGIRTVVEDAMHAVTDPALFISARLSAVVRTAQEFNSGRDWRGIKRTSLEQLGDVARWLIPITVDQPVAHTRTDSALAASGITVRSATSQQKIYQLLRDFRVKNNLISPADKAGMTAPSEYTVLRNALLEGNEKDARDAYTELLHPSAGVKPKTAQQIREHFSRATTAPFSGSTAVEARFRASLDAKGRAAYQEARRERQQELSRLLQWQHRWR